MTRHHVSFAVSGLLMALLALAPIGAFAKGGPDDKVDVIVVYENRPGDAEERQAKDLGGDVKREFDNFDMRVISISKNAVENLGKAKGVKFVAPDRETFGMAYLFSVAPTETAPTESAAHATANLPDAASNNASFNGGGVGIAVIDSGIGDHMDLSASIRQYDFLNGAFPRPLIDWGEVDEYRSDPRADGLGHGTHVAGILSGSGSASSGQHKGAALGAKLLSLRTLDDDGRGVASDTIAALDWLLSYGQYFDIEVVNMSIGKAVEESNATDPLVLAVEQVWDAGIVVVVAAGNHGRDGHMTITSPANSRKAITVGSLTDSGTADFSDDYPSTYSSMGPTLGDHVLKPDLIAPGNKVTATVSMNAKLKTDLTSRLGKCVNSYGDADYVYCSADYLELSGTSMAAPLVAAAAARMLEKDSSLAPATIKARLMRSARKIDAEPTAAGAGVLDVEAALNETGTVTGEALSPLMARSEEGPVILVEDTAKLWGDTTWGSGYIWTDGYLWTDSYLWTDGYVWTDGYLWTDGYVWTDSYLWTDGYLWTDSYMWTDGYVWTDAVTNYDPLYGSSSQTVSLDDD